MTPRSNHLLIRRLPPEAQSAGGIHLPDTARELPAEGQVLAVGPGLWVGTVSAWVMCQVQPGERVIWPEGRGQPVTGDREEMVLADGDLMAVVSADGTIEPLNDWVMVEVHGRRRESVGGITLPDAARDYEKKGKVISFGPGTLRQEDGRCIMAGTRRRVPAIVGLSRAEDLLDKTVYWDNSQEFVAIATPDGRDCLMVRAISLIALEEPQ